MGLPQCLSAGISGRLGKEEEVVTVERVVLVHLADGYWDVGSSVFAPVLYWPGGSSTHQPGDKWGIYLEADWDQNS